MNCSNYKNINENQIYNVHNNEIIKGNVNSVKTFNTIN